MMTQPLIKHLLVVGTGLIGGSFALALKKAGAVEKITGIDRNIASLEQAKSLGIIDEIATDFSSGVPHADVILLATPVAQTQRVLDSILPYLKTSTLVTDVGSVKGAVEQMARASLQNRINQFIPAHPIAGSEKSGPEAAQADLFKNKKLIVTALPENAPEQVMLLSQLWQSVGAVIYTLNPQEHDQIFGAVSHLPQLLVYAFMDAIAEKKEKHQLFEYAGTGFRDFTRLAGSSPEMWRDISALNRAAIVADLDNFMTQLIRLRSLLTNANVEGLSELFSTAQQAHHDYVSVTKTPQL